MRKLKFLSINLLIFTFLGCQNDENPSLLVQQYVVFSIGQIAPVELKSNDEVECPFDEAGNLKIPTVAEVIINGATYYPEIYFLNGKLYTQSIKLDLPDGAEATYNVSRFALLETIGGDIVMATPIKGSYYASYVNTGVDFDIEVTPFKKTEVQIDVLCFVPWASILFGYHNGDNIDHETANHYNASRLSNSTLINKPVVNFDPFNTMMIGISNDNRLEKENRIGQIRKLEYTQYQAWFPDVDVLTKHTI